MAEIVNSLKRLVGDVITHPMTIGKVLANYGPKRKKNYPKSIHLVGTGNLEVSVSQSEKYSISGVRCSDLSQFCWHGTFGVKKVSQQI